MKTFFKNGRIVVLVTGISLIITFFVLMSFENKLNENDLKALKRSELSIITLENDVFKNEIDSIIGDLGYLNYAYGSDLDKRSNHNAIAEKWIIFSDQKRIYNQIRFIDINGDEIIRIEFNQNGSYSVNKSTLQNKKNRYYFEDTADLENGDIYISPIDLNIESNIIQTPFVPMIRVSTPVFNDDGDRIGIIVLNYFATDLLDKLKKIADNSQGEIYLLNKEGYWISSPNKEDEWHFMFEDQLDLTFAKQYPEVWAAIKSDAHELITQEGLFIFEKMNTSKIELDNIDDDNTVYDANELIIVSKLDRNGIHKNLLDDEYLQKSINVVSKYKIHFMVIFLIAFSISLEIYNSKKTFEQIKYFSEYDAFTDVYNRATGYSKLFDTLKKVQKTNLNVSLCFIDINGLKEVNDNLGHAYGDELIKTVANVIKSSIRKDDIFSRLGGDEFMVVFYNRNKEESQAIWSRILAHLDEINQNENRPYFISLSHGIRDDVKEPSLIDDYIKEADEKMYEEKRTIKQNLSVLKKDPNNKEG